MNNRTITLTVSAGFEEVFGFFADPESLPLWATHFCQSVEKRDDGWVIRSARDEMVLVVDTHEAGGCIDMYAGPDYDHLHMMPMRVFSLPAGKAAISFTLLQYPETGNRAFYEQYCMLLDEVRAVAERFGGGEISAPEGVGTKATVGIVSNDLASSRDFYVKHFGFRAVFDAPCYVHLVEPDSGSEIGFLAPVPEGEAAAQPAMAKATTGEGVWLSLAVKDVDAEFERLYGEGLRFLEKPTDQPWGERTCALEDPNGVLIYVSQKIDSMDDSFKEFVVEESVGV